MGETHHRLNGFNGLNGIEDDLIPSNPFSLLSPAAPFNPLNPPLNPVDPNTLLLSGAFNRLSLSTPALDAASIFHEIQFHQDRIRSLQTILLSTNSYVPHSNVLTGCRCHLCRQAEEEADGILAADRLLFRRAGSFDDHLPSRLHNSQIPRLLDPAMNIPLERLRGKLASMARDQHGCRYLQKKVEGENRDEIDMIFAEIRNHICDLMVDQSGNYLVQKLLDTCNGDQRNHIIFSVTKSPQVFHNICCNTYGTRTIQKLLERIANVDQQTRVIDAMRPVTVDLVTNAHGHHVVQYCLKKFPNELKKDIFDEVAAHSLEIARHQNGCCILQQCMQHSCGEIRERLLAEIAKNSLALSQDPYGNYVVQYLLDMRVPQYTTRVLHYLEGNYTLLSLQKCSSHVVEKCLSLSSPIETTQIIRELITSPDTLKLLQDAYGNYVIQCSLKIAVRVDIGTFYEIVSTVRKHDTSLRSHPYGKRILHLIDQLMK